MNQSMDGCTLSYLQSSSIEDIRNSILLEYAREEEILENVSEQMMKLGSPEWQYLNSREYKGIKYYTFIKDTYNAKGEKITKYIGRNDNQECDGLIKQVIIHRYLEELSKQVKSNLAVMDRATKVFRAIDPNEICAGWGQSYFPLPEECYQIIGGLNINRWRDEHLTEHRINEPKYPQDLRHQADHNLLVRSKSEVIICNQLIQNNLAFIYEPDLKLGKYTISPDFLVLSEKKRKLFVWEHMGMLDDPKYMKNALWKLQHYQDEGIVFGQNLIVTYDDPETGINSAEISEIIRKHFLRDQNQEKGLEARNMQ